MIIADAAVFIGRFHPLLVHLPIGFLLLAVILAVVGRREKYSAIQPAVSFALLAGTICAILACITGYILSTSGDYNDDVLTIHMWGGITTAIVSLFAYLVSIKIIPVNLLQTGGALVTTLIIMVITISVTGHFGGTLTHGEGYISSDVLFGKTKEKKLITDINEAVIYEDLVEPILEKKCSNCHNSSKKKGEFSMATYQTLLKGGKHGAVIEVGHSNKSELIKRVSLNPKDEKYMPADGKPDLSEDEKTIISWWIDKAGASRSAKVKEMGATTSIKNEITAYLGLQKNAAEEQDDSDSSNGYFAHLNVPKISEQQVNTIKHAGFVIKYLHLKPLLLDVTLPVKKDAAADTAFIKLKELLAVKNNIAWLNVAGNNVPDGALDVISQFSNLQRLKLDNNPVTDAGVSKLKSLVNLESLNLYNTKVTGQGVAILSSLTKLKHLYVWGTGIKKDSSLKVVTGVN